MLLPDTIFMDSRGAAHLGLDVEDHHKLLRALQVCGQQCDRSALMYIVSGQSGAAAGTQHHERTLKFVAGMLSIAASMMQQCSAGNRYCKGRGACVLLEG